MEERTIEAMLFFKIDDNIYYPRKHIKEKRLNLLGELSSSSLFSMTKTTTSSSSVASESETEKEIASATAIADNPSSSSSQEVEDALIKAVLVTKIILLQ